MTQRFGSLLRQSVGRIRMYMDALLLTIGGILIPLGFYLKIEAPDWEPYGSVGILLGMAAWLGAYFFLKDKQHKEKLERQKEEVSRTAERKENTQLLMDIRGELRRMNQDERNN